MAEESTANIRNLEPKVNTFHILFIHILQQCPQELLELDPAHDEVRGTEDVLCMDHLLG
jgi:hypothetical protein